MADEHDQHGGGDGHAKKPHKKHGHGHGGGHEEHEEGVPEWVVSFADNVLLQMGFFVILLAMNMGVKAQGPTSEGDQTSAAKSQNDALLDFALAVRSGFNNPIDLNSSAAEDKALVRRALEKLNQRRGDSPEENTTGQDKQAQNVRNGENRAPSVRVTFEDRSIELSEPAKRQLDDAARKFAGSRWILEIRGNASRLESVRDIQRSRQLSYERAFAAATYLVNQGLKWEQIRLVAAGDSFLATPRARTSGEHASNQSAEVYQLTETMPSDPFNTDK